MVLIKISLTRRRKEHPAHDNRKWGRRLSSNSKQLAEARDASIDLSGSVIFAASDNPSDSASLLELVDTSTACRMDLTSSSRPDTQLVSNSYAQPPKSVLAIGSRNILVDDTWNSAPEMVLAPPVSESPGPEVKSGGVTPKVASTTEVQPKTVDTGMLREDHSIVQSRMGSKYASGSQKKLVSNSCAPPSTCSHAVDSRNILVHDTWDSSPEMVLAPPIFENTGPDVDSGEVTPKATSSTEVHPRTVDMVREDQPSLNATISEHDDGYLLGTESPEEMDSQNVETSIALDEVTQVILEQEIEDDEDLSTTESTEQRIGSRHLDISIALDEFTQDMLEQETDDGGDLLATESTEKIDSEHLEASAALDEFMQDIIDQGADEVEEGISIPHIIGGWSIGRESDNATRRCQTVGEEQNGSVDNVVEYVVDNADLGSVHMEGDEAPVLQSSIGELLGSDVGPVVCFEDDKRPSALPLHQKELSKSCTEEKSGLDGLEFPSIKQLKERLFGAKTEVVSKSKSSPKRSPAVDARGSTAIAGANDTKRSNSFVNTVKSFDSPGKRSLIIKDEIENPIDQPDDVAATRHEESILSVGSVLLDLPTKEYPQTRADPQPASSSSSETFTLDESYNIPEGCEVESELHPLPLMQKDSITSTETKSFHEMAVAASDSNISDGAEDSGVIEYELRPLPMRKKDSTISTHTEFTQQMDIRASGSDLSEDSMDAEDHLSIRVFTDIDASPCIIELMQQEQGHEFVHSTTAVQEVGLPSAVDNILPETAVETSKSEYIPGFGSKDIRMNWTIAMSPNPQTGVYRGPVAACGTPNGKGRILFANGNEYIGPFEMGEMHGENARVSELSGGIYKGDFQHDLRHGNGEYTTSNRRYVGQFEHGRPHGEGILYYLDGSIDYEGRWVFGEPLPEMLGQDKDADAFLLALFVDLVVDFDDECINSEDARPVPDATIHYAVFAEDWEDFIGGLQKEEARLEREKTIVLMSC